MIEETVRYRERLIQMTLLYSKAMRLKYSQKNEN